MQKMLLLTFFASFALAQASGADAPAAPAKHYTACTLMPLEDAKALIGADATLQPDSSTDDHCYYRSSEGAAYLHIADSATGHLWTDYKAEGKQVKGVGDEAYFYPTKNPLGNTLMVRKGDRVFMINARSDDLSDEKIQGKELAFSRKMATRL